MSSTRSRITAFVSLSLSYILVVLLCTPFVVSARVLSKPAANTQEQSPARYRDGELLVRAGLGLGISTMIGIRGVGFGIRGAMHAAGDTAVPVFGRILSTLSEAGDSGVIATAFSLIGGGVARQAIREAGENSARTDARLKDCERQFPNANHSLSFLNL